MCIRDRTGLDVLEKIRSEDLISPAFIIMSGYDDFEFARRAVSLAAVEYLLKPFRPDDVIMAIQKSIKHLELIRSSYPDAPSPDSKKKSLAGNAIDFSLLHYPSREEHRMLELSLIHICIAITSANFLFINGSSLDLCLFLSDVYKRQFQYHPPCCGVLDD